VWRQRRNSRAGRSRRSIISPTSRPAATPRWLGKSPSGGSTPRSILASTPTSTPQWISVCSFRLMYSPPPSLVGQASASLLMGYRNNDSSLSASATATTDIPPRSITRSVALQQDTTGVADLIPQFAVRWNAGVNNYMAYITGDIPVGLYLSSNLANIGLGH